LAIYPHPVNDAELWLLAAALGIDMAGLSPPGSRRRPPLALIAVARRIPRE
jgi:hypothetical protein